MGERSCLGLDMVIFFLGATIAAFAFFGSLYVLYFAWVGRGTRYVPEFPPSTIGPSTRFLVLVPAHNEEGGIAPTLDSLRRQRYPNKLYRVVVIADNCQDGTAATVEREGFECWVRNAPQAPGKGQALRWALGRANELVFDAVVFVDADSTLEPGALGTLDRELKTGARALQLFNEFEPSDRGWFSLLAVASHRAAGRLFWGPRQRLGLSVSLQGTGFCLRRDVLGHVPWKAYSIVEDVEYSLNLLLRGIWVDFVPSIKVTSRLSRSVAEATPQRLRWASGTLQVILRYVPRLLMAALRERDFCLAEAALALSLSSRMVLLYAGLLALATSFLAATFWQALLIWVMVASAGVLQFTYLLCVLRTVSGEGSVWRGVVFLPAYLGWMLLVHCLAALGIRRKAWTRASR